MKINYLFICLFGISLITYSCKNDSNTSTQNTEIGEEKEKQLGTKQNEVLFSSVLAKAMITPEVKTFLGFLITTEQIDVLSKEDEPHTIFAPTNDAFKLLDEKKMKDFLNPANKKELTKIIRSHIVSGKLDSGSLVQNINDGNGSYQIQTLSGTTLTASQEGAEIILTDSNGQKAALGKSDINGSNGILHVLNAVLAVD